MFGLEPVWTGFGIFAMAFVYIAGIGFTFKLLEDNFNPAEGELLGLCSLIWPISWMIVIGMMVGTLATNGTIQNSIKKIVNRKKSSDSSDTTKSF